jgi:glycosyltransferase involved in cell wall biosynthesis
MRIAIYSVLSLNNGAGAERWIGHVSTRLHARGQELVIITTKHGKDNDQSIKDNLLRTGVRVIEFDNYNLFKIPRVRYLRQLLSILRGMDVIYFNNAYALNDVIIYMLQKLSNVRVLVGHHGAFPETGGFPRRFYHRYVNRNICKVFDGHHVLNRIREDLLISWGYNNVTKIPNGVDTSILIPNKKFDKFTVMFAGSMIPQKGIDRLAKAIRLINGSKTKSDMDFLVFGTGLNSTIAKELEEEFYNVKYLGYAASPVLQNAYRKCHVLVSPSRYDEFPLAPLEALSSGTPVIGSDIVAMQDIVIKGKTGFLIDCDIESEIARSINYLRDLWYNNRKVYEAYALNARTLALKFDWDIITDLFQKFLGDIKEIK